MKIGVADYGLDVWDGGCFDIEQRLSGLKQIGYEGIERLSASGAEEAIQKAAIYRKLDMGFATCRGPTVETTIQWTAGFGKSYIWIALQTKHLDVFCRQANILMEACQRCGLRAALHNHLGSPVESQKQLEEFLVQCPRCGLILDTAHLAAGRRRPAEDCK